MLGEEESLFETVRGIIDLCVIPGEVQLDFADVRHCLDVGDLILAGTGIAADARDAGEAALAAISKPLFGSQSLHCVRCALLNIVTGTELDPEVLTEVCSAVQQALPADAEMLVGSGMDMNGDEEIRITLLAFGGREDADAQGAASA